MEKIGFEYVIEAERARREMSALEVIGNRLDRNFTQQERSARSLENALRNLGTNGASNFDKADKSAGRFHGTLKDIAGLVSAGLIVGAGKQLLDISRAGEKANNQLAASATEAGLAYSDLSARAQKFGIDARANQLEAIKLTNEITRLAKASGNTNDIEKISKAALDLKVARGLDNTELIDLLGAIRSGSSDEPLNRAGFNDPGKSADLYAKSIGKSSEALSEQEKVLSRLLPFYQSAALFTGENEKALNGLNGQAELAAKSFSDIQAAIAAGLTETNEFRDALKLINESLAYLRGLDAITIKVRLQAGETPEQLAKEKANAPGQKILDSFKNTTGLIGAIPSLIYGTTLAPKEQRGDYLRFFREAATGAGKRTEQTELQKLIGEKAALDSQTQKASDNSLDELRKSVKEQVTKQATDRAKALQDELENGAEISREQITEFVEFVRSRRKVLSDSDVKKFAATVQASTKELISDLTGKDVNAEKINQASSLLEENKNFFNGRDYRQASEQIESALKKATESAKSLRAEVRSVLGEALFADDKQNPFARVFLQMATAEERAREKFKDFGADFAAQMAKVEKDTLAAELVVLRFTSRLAALQQTQEANRLERGLIGETGAQSRRNDALGFQINDLTSGVDFGREAAFFRALNDVNPNNPGQSRPVRIDEILSDRKMLALLEPFSNGDRTNTGQAQNAIQDLLAQIEALRALDSGGSANGQDLIAQAVLGQISRVDQNALRFSNADEFRTLREFAAQANDSRAGASRLKMLESLDRERAGAQIKNDSLEQLDLLKKSGLNDRDKVAQFLAISGQLNENELTGDLRLQRAAAFRESARFEVETEQRGEQRAAKLESFIDALTKNLTEKGLKVDSGASALVEINAPVQALERPGQSSMIDAFAGFVSFGN